VATVASIVTNLRANTGQFDKALDGAKRRMRDFGKMPGGGGFNDLNDQLKSIFGRGSALKEGLEILAGGGAIVGISMLTKQIKGMAESVQGLAESFADPRISKADAFGKLLQSVPVVGDLASAFKTLTVTAVDFFSSTTSGAEKAAAEIKAVAEALNQIPTDMLNAARANGAETAALANANPGDAPAIQEKFRLEKELNDIEAKRKDFYDQAVKNNLNPADMAAGDTKFFDMREQARVDSANR
jgi:hypothetical protein